MQLNDAEMSWITNHFGHTKDVHYAWYRQEESTIELTKMAKILNAVDDGEDLKRKQIDDLGQHDQNEGHDEDLLQGRQNFESAYLKFELFYL